MWDGNLGVSVKPNKKRKHNQEQKGYQDRFKLTQEEKFLLHRAGTKTQIPVLDIPQSCLRCLKRQQNLVGLPEHPQSQRDFDESLEEHHRSR